MDARQDSAAARGREAHGVRAERARGAGRTAAGVALVLAIFALLALVHAWRLPLFEGPDEPGNLQYLQFVAVEHRLAQPSLVPTHELEVLDRGILPPLWFVALAPLTAAVGADAWRATPVANPAFLRRASAAEHASAAPSARLHWLHGRDEHPDTASPAVRGVRALRASAIAFAVLALLAVWRAARLVAPLAARDARGRERFALGTLALCALTPQLQHLSGTVTMDLAVAAFGSLAVVAAARWRVAPDARGARRRALEAGAWTALCALTKLNGLVLLPALALAGSTAGVPWTRARWRARCGPLALAAVAVLAIAGPWYAWGALETGHPLWMWRYQQVSPFHNPGGAFDAPHTFERWSQALGTLVLTWLGDLAWTSVWLPLPALVFVTVLFAGVAGAAVAVAVRAGPRAALVARLAPVTALAVVAVTWIEPWVRAFASGAMERFGSYAAIALAWILVVCGPRLARGRGEVERGAPSSDAPSRRDAHDADDTGDPSRSRAVLGFLLAAAALILGAEVYFNLRFSQPQARHLYPFLPALVMPVALGLARLRLLGVAVVLHAALSCFTLLLVEQHLRPPGWNTSALVHATDALRQPAEPDVDAPVWLAPAAGARPIEPPVLVFEDPAGGMHEILVGLDNPDLGSWPWREHERLLRTGRDLGVALEGERVELAIPAALWERVPVGARIDAVVLRLDARGAATARSAPLTFHRGG